jgi:hypothetical protein
VTAPLPEATFRPDLRTDRGRGYRRISEKAVEVFDLDLASWFHLNNLPVVEVCTNGREFAVTFYDLAVKDGTSKADDLSVKWLNSEACRFSSALRQIKKVAISSPRRAYNR